MALAPGASSHRARHGRRQAHQAKSNKGSASRLSFSAHFHLKQLSTWWSLVIRDTLRPWSSWSILKHTKSCSQCQWSLVCAGSMKSEHTWNARAAGSGQGSPSHSPGAQWSGQCPGPLPWPGDIIISLTRLSIITTLHTMWRGGAMIPDQLLTWHSVEIPVLTRPRSAPQLHLSARMLGWATANKSREEEKYLFCDDYPFLFTINGQSSEMPDILWKYAAASLHLARMSNVRSVFRSRDQYWPIRGQCGHWRPMRGRGESGQWAGAGAGCVIVTADQDQWVSLMSVWPPSVQYPVIMAGPGSQSELMFRWQWCGINFYPLLFLATFNIFFYKNNYVCE